eukprot:TRINITY_DN25049_c0_g1_i1.p1 TRINITY_DN25049_c0_g1~~TRINITY_DN25049_c0_g1_i1.p1  ORF type:complete len:194 (-),score=27.54 TRINITY_DN25049_c0_g1_i1:278-808(-)
MHNDGNSVSLSLRENSGSLSSVSQEQYLEKKSKFRTGNQFIGGHDIQAVVFQEHCTTGQNKHKFLHRTLDNGSEKRKMSDYQNIYTPHCGNEIPPHCISSYISPNGPPSNGVISPSARVSPFIFSSTSNRVHNLEGCLSSAFSDSGSSLDTDLGGVCTLVKPMVMSCTCCLLFVYP